MGCSPKVMPGSTAALMMYVSVCAFIILCAAFGCTCWGRVNAAEVTQTDAMLALVTLLRWLLGNPGRRRQPHKIILKAGLFFPGLGQEKCLVAVNQLLSCSCLLLAWPEHGSIRKLSTSQRLAGIHPEQEASGKPSGRRSILEPHKSTI